MKQENRHASLSLLVLSAEFLTLYVILPAAYAAGIFHFPKIPMLAGVSLYCFLILRHNGGISFKREMNLSMLRPALPGLLFRAGLVALGTLAVTALFLPEHLFSFPSQRPSIWLMVMFLYPLLSAFPQEFIYRAFMAKRYKRLFGKRTLLVSALAFGFLHIIYLNAVAVLLSVVAGLLFARVYRKTNSLTAATVEHALYGCIIFTVGLGKFFYSNPGN